jgi:hypothetical protein
MNADLPELPRPFVVHWADTQQELVYYTADQMRAYGAACAAAAMERAAALCDNVRANYTRHYTTGASECAAVIRQAKEKT